MSLPSQAPVELSPGVYYIPARLPCTWSIKTESFSNRVFWRAFSSLSSCRNATMNVTLDITISQSSFCCLYSYWKKCSHFTRLKYICGKEGYKTNARALTALASHTGISFPLPSIPHNSLDYDLWSFLLSYNMLKKDVVHLMICLDGDIICQGSCYLSFEHNSIMVTFSGSSWISIHTLSIEHLFSALFATSNLFYGHQLILLAHCDHVLCPYGHWLTTLLILTVFD